MGLQCELDVAPSFDTQPANNLKTGSAEHLIFVVTQCLAGCHHYTISGMHPHRIQVFHVANGDTVICAVSHHLILNLFPADKRAFQQNLGDRAGRQTSTGKSLKFFFSVCYPPTTAT